MKLSGSILVVDDNEGIISALRLLLPQYFSKVKCINSPKSIMSSLGEDAFNVVLLDMNFTSEVNNGNEGLFWLTEIKKSHPRTEVVLFTAYADIDLAIEGMKRGAFDFIVKPWDNEKLVSTLKAAYTLSSGKDMPRKQSAPDKKNGMYWGVSENMARLKEQVSRIAATDASVLITGENGTGKDMLAKDIHRLSARRGGPMVSVDMGAIPETLFESELFGHVKGAFTDARSDRTGKFEEADGGTLFLDEIGNIPLHLQAKLLRVLQDRAVVRVGSNKPLPVNIRLVCATNSDIERLVSEGSFREDLYYRINTLHLHLPPLRERKGDIEELSEAFCDEQRNALRKNIEISEDARAAMNAYQWPGNVRELRNAIEFSVNNMEDVTIEARHLPYRIRFEGGSATDGPVRRLSEVIREAEKNEIAKAINTYGGGLEGKKKAAEALGISLASLYNKMK